MLADGGDRGDLLQDERRAVCTLAALIQFDLEGACAITMVGVEGESGAVGPAAAQGDEHLHHRRAQL